MASGSGSRLRAWYPVAAVLAGTAILVGAIVLGANRIIESTISNQMRETQEDARVSGIVLRESLSHIVTQVSALHGLARMVTVGRRTGAADMERAANQELSRWQEAGDGRVLPSVSAIRADGHLDWALPRQTTPPLYLGDRDYFQRIASGQTKSFVSKDVTGRLSGDRIIQFAHGIYDASGTFQGITVISVRQNRLWDLPGRLSLLPFDAVTLLRRDGTVIARSNDNQTVAALPLDSPLMRAVLAQSSAMLHGPCPFDQRLRIGVSERIPGTDLILLVGRDVDTRMQALAPTLERIRLASYAAMAIVVVLGLGLGALLHVRRRVAVIKAQATLLQQSEALFRQMAEGLPDLVRLQDAEGKVIYASPAAREIVGVEPEQMLGHPTGDYVHPDDRHRMVTRRRSDGTFGAEGRSELRIIRPDGRTIWAQTNIRKITMDTGEGTETRIVSVSRDITRQHEAEEALRHAKEELDALLTASRSALFRVRLEPCGQLRLTYASANLVDVLGFTPQEAMANPHLLAKRRDPAFAEAVRSYFDQLMDAGPSMTKYPFQHRNGQWIWISVWASRTADEDAPTAVGFVTDVTRQQLAEIQVMQHAKLAMLGEMSSSIAHELNQPLTVIGLTADGIMAQLDRDPSDTAQLRRQVQRIVAQISRAATIVHHMRVFGRKADGPPVAVSVSRSLDGALAVVAPQMERNAIRAETRVVDNLPFVRGYQVLLEQVLVNLIDNAVQAIQAHQPPLPPERRWIELNACSDDTMVEITITDHAGGIDAAVLPRIFEPFFTTKPLGKGTGLGLSISYGVVSDMGGQICAKNVGNGAQFTIRLPALPASQGGADVAVGQASAAAPAK